MILNPKEEPTLTLAPTDTKESLPTDEPKPCNDAFYVSETIPDGTEFTVGESFTKTWRLENTGTCTWNTNYKLVFNEGDKMGGPSSKNLTQSVAPGRAGGYQRRPRRPGHSRYLQRHLADRG